MIARLLTASTYVLLGVDAPRARRSASIRPPRRARRSVRSCRAGGRPAERPPQRRRAGGRWRAAAPSRSPVGALALTGSVIPTTIAGHASSTGADPAAREPQRIKSHQNMSMIGGLPSAVDRARRAPTATDGAGGRGWVTPRQQPRPLLAACPAARTCSTKSAEHESCGRHAGGGKPRRCGPAGSLPRGRPGLQAMFDPPFSLFGAA